MSKSRLPRHVGFIPDGNRRWAQARGLPRQEGYASGVQPGLELYRRCRELGLEEISIYGFTQDNTRRPSEQKAAFSAACVDYARGLAEMDAALLALGEQSPQFPEALRPWARRRGSGMKVNLLVNYGWEWDLDGLRSGELRSSEVSRIDMVVRWGGGRRLSGFLPAQSVYADFFVLDELWPDYQEQHFDSALAWFRQQDRTLGG